MLIDWVTVIAQMINFLLLVFLLNRFLFKPVLKIVEERNYTIRKTLAEADIKGKEAIKEKEDFFQEKEALSKQKDAYMTAGRMEAEQEKEHLLQEAKKEHEDLRTLFQINLQKEKEIVFSKMKKKIENEVFFLVQKVLKDLSNEDLEDTIIKIFLQKLQKASDEEKQPLLHEIQKDNSSLLLKSSFTLSFPSSLSLEKGIKDVFGRNVSLSFEKDPSLICGIILETKGHKMEWNFSHYLDSFRNSI